MNDTQYAYITITEEAPVGKTKRFTVKNTKSDRNIGEIKWYAQWRQYCFFPIGGTVFSAGCLKDITHFIGKAMDDHAAAIVEQRKEKA